MAPGPDSSDVGSLASDDGSSPPSDVGSTVSSPGDDNPVGAAAAPAPQRGGSKRNCVRNFVRDLLSRR